MKLFYVERTDNWGWDEYDSCVVAAECEADAEIIINPSLRDYERIDNKIKEFYQLSTGKTYISDDSQEYCDRGKHTITYIGESVLTEPSIVCSSFNAG